MDKEIESKFDALEAKFASLIEALDSKLESLVAPVQESDEEKASVDVDSAIEAGKKIAESGLPDVAATRVREAVKKGVDVDSALEAERAYLKEAVAATATPVVEKDEDTFGKIGW